MASTESSTPAPPPRRRGGKRAQDPCQLVLALESSPSESGFPGVHTSVHEAKIYASCGQIPIVALVADDTNSLAPHSLARESDHHTAMGDAKQSIVIAATDILCTQRGPLGAFAIAEGLQNTKGLSFPKKRLKDLLLAACPEHFEYETASDKFWANVTEVSEVGNGRSVSIRTAAVIEAVKQMVARRLPAETNALYSGLSEQVRSQITRELFDLVLKTADTGLGDLRQNEAGRWFLAQHGDLDPFKRRPTKMYGPLRRALLKILTASQYSLPPQKIFAALPQRIARHFTAANIEEHLAKVSRGLGRDTAGYLSIKRATPLNKPGKRRTPLSKLARTAAIVDTAIDRLEAERRVLSLDDLYAPTCGIDRDAFRKAMNQRQKSSSELERIDEGRYRYNPVLVEKT